MTHAQCKKGRRSSEDRAGRRRRREADAGVAFRCQVGIEGARFLRCARVISIIVERHRSASARRESMTRLSLLASRVR